MTLRELKRSIRRLIVSRTFLGGFIGGFIRRLIGVALPKGTIVRIPFGKLKGFRMIASPGFYAYCLGLHEYHKQVLLSSFIQPGMIVYDVGAHGGFYSLLASAVVGENGHVYAFEPLPDNISYLKEVIKLNRANNITIIDAAVSDSSGPMLFDSSGGSSEGKLTEMGNLSVRSIRLDDAVLPPPSVIKMDIEGGEANALEGSSKVIAAHKPVIFFATHGFDIKRQCLQLLSRQGYTVYMIDQEISELVAIPQSPLGQILLSQTRILAPFPFDNDRDSAA
jgi:FkbM family methyltransferase